MTARCHTSGRLLAAFLFLAAPALAETPASEPEKQADEESARLENVVRWSTASEVDNFGYDVYRGDFEEGPFERITREPIPGAGTTDEPQQYAYVDATIEPDRAYFYYVESISLSGVREKFTPVIQAKPKPAPKPG